MDLTGRTLGKYHILAEIGRGGMGVVYRAFDPTLEREVAIKVLAPHLAWEKEFLQRFLREARAAAKLDHPNIVHIYEVGQEGDLYYFAMAYLAGQSLSEIVAQRGPLPVPQAIAIAEQIASALDYAHKHGLVHRDVKSSNILVDEEGRAVLTDFGIVRAASGTRLTATGLTLGTPEYMAPEQARGEEATEASDLYSLGVVVYEMLGGDVPFHAATPAAVLVKHMLEPAPPLRSRNPEVPEAVERVVEWALSKDPRARPASGAEFVAALKAAAEGRAPEVATEALEATVPPPPRPAEGSRAAAEGRAPEVATEVLEAAVPPPPRPAPERGGAAAVPAPPVGPARPAARPEGIPLGARRRLAGWVWGLLGLVAVGVVVAVALVARGIPGGGRRPPVTPLAYTQPTAPPTASPTLVLPVLKDTQPTAPPTPSPTLVLPVLEGTPVPRPAARISPENAGQVVQLARLGRGWIGAVAYSPDGRLLAVASSIGVYLYETRTLQVVRFLETEADVESVSFSPDGALLASGGLDCTIRLWRVSDGALLQTLGHTAYVWSVSFSPDGSLLASGLEDGTIRLWRVSDGSLVRTLEGHGGRVYSLSFSPDGLLLASGARDPTIRLWRVTDGRLVGTLEGHTSDVGSVSFSPDGALLASGSLDGTIRLWRVSDGALLRTLEGYPGFVASVLFSRDGLLLASGGEDSVIRLWRVSDGALLHTLEGHANGVKSLSFSPDGSVLASGSADHTVLLWGIW